MGTLTPEAWNLLARPITLTPEAWNLLARPILDKPLWAVLVGEEPCLVRSWRPWWAFWRPAMVPGWRPWRSVPVSCPLQRSPHGGDGVRLSNPYTLDFGSIPTDRVVVHRVEVLHSSGTTLIRLPITVPRYIRAGDSFHMAAGALELSFD